LWRTLLRFLKKVMIGVLNNPYIPILDTYPKEMK
jgi:hypothetical protein